MNLFTSLLALLLALSQAAAALEPPPADAPSRSRARIAAALGIGNQSFAPHLVGNLRERLSGNKGANLLSGTRGAGLPSVGKPKMLVLLVEFDEYPSKPADTAEAMAATIFGSSGQFPYESLSAYYRRSSYGKLNIEGNVLGWYKAGRRADVAETWEGREAVIKKALQNYKGHDFSQYDNNGDGVIDYFAVIWTGPIGDWATFWWASAPKFADKSFTVGGKSLNAYAWQGIVAKWDDPDASFKTNILVHETGHSLGLPDYYDYKPAVGPAGGLGYFDMMDANRFDHNCFSKLMLGWIEPQVVSSAGTYTLRPASDSGDCVMLLPPGRAKNPFGEFFLVENRRKYGNDTDNALISGGLVVWHVDARLNTEGNNFLYNNSDTEHKLLKVMEADGLEELEKGLSRSFGFWDFYVRDRALGPETVPSSRLYDGTDTGISLVSRGGAQEASFAVTFK
ncbi:MAG: hypothetical protein A2X35_00795 [Elusimicrobia bacterium GWA2_61_42]|nr:MAG: hypothetical protein A2X35_00795 [Elusimicrobia bacterium GWA2_61_42]OGR75247.1 MAG: hypothetical protein A2X38_04990 [Elusimicrobia bacterium GWC2_61_25]